MSFSSMDHIEGAESYISNKFRHSREDGNDSYYKAELSFKTEKRVTCIELAAHHQEG